MECVKSSSISGRFSVGVSVTMINSSEVFASFGHSQWSRDLSCGSGPAHLLIIAGSNPAGGMDVCLWRVWCVIR